MRSEKAQAILQLLTQAITKRCQEARLSLKAKSGCQLITSSLGTCKLSHTHQSSSEQNSCGSSQTPCTSTNATHVTAALKTQMYIWLNQCLLTSHRPDSSP